MTERSAGSNGAAASIMAQDMTARRLLFFKSMIASIGLISQKLRRNRPFMVQVLRQTEVAVQGPILGQPI
ncbi:hypothetical protein PkoCFBP13504_05805 [Pseudomonas koreensis]|nr:hypothetical protein CCX46_14460 [Pseudomonas sp. RU47]TKJ86939.1 hypothetical protein PkoCFBP13504_05805 [Pseudomonas koreensis]